MNKKEKSLINTLPKFSEHLKDELKNPQYAQEWVKSILKDYEETKDLNELVYNLKPLIEANYTIGDFAAKIGVNRVSLYKIFSNKTKPSIDMLSKIFTGLGFELKFDIRKIA